MNKFNSALVFGHDSIAKITPRPDDDYVISTDIVGGRHRVMINGRIVRTFIGPDAERQTKGYALAMLDERPLQPQEQQRDAWGRTDEDFEQDYGSRPRFNTGRK